MAEAPDDDGEEDLVRLLHLQADELALGMFESVRSLPTVPKDEAAPHAAVAQRAGHILQMSREFDALVDRVALRWPESHEEQSALLASARLRHAAAADDVLDAARDLECVRDAVRDALGALLDSTCGAKARPDPTNDAAARERIRALRAIVNQE
ncbi:hypothetical protein M885DRAFT_513442 [Pelagophyceae sp. CCMP2097]|nr:hypothetical protein M885DRAFT_513442 [Pelagophyceae sp. CCMP2097]